MLDPCLLVITYLNLLNFIETGFNINFETYYIIKSSSSWLLRAKNWYIMSYIDKMEIETSRKSVLTQEKLLLIVNGCQ